jgi:hypothetical protein
MPVQNYRFTDRRFEPPVWDDIRVAANSVRLPGGPTDPAFSQFRDDGGVSTGVFTFFFAAGALNEVHFTVQIPHKYKLLTPLYPHVHWSPTNTNTGFVRWGLEYTIQCIGSVFPLTSTLTVDDPGNGVDREHQIVSFDTISGATISTVSCMLDCRLYRDATNDDYNSNAAFLEFDIHYQIDSTGSDREFVK